VIAWQTFGQLRFRFDRAYPLFVQCQSSVSNIQNNTAMNNVMYYSLIVFVDESVANNCSLTERVWHGKFKWHSVIINILQQTSNKQLPLKKLRKKVILSLLVYFWNFQTFIFLQFLLGNFSENIISVPSCNGRGDF